MADRNVADARPRLRLWLAIGLLAIGAGLAVVALLGPLLTGVVDYRVTETLRNQTLGLDLVSLVVIAPLCVLAAILLVRGHVVGPALALGIGAYTSYMFVQYILGPNYTDLPGNNERLFPLFLLLFTAGWIVALAAWHALEVERLTMSRHRDRMVGRVVLPVLAFLAFFRYGPALADWMSSTPEDEGYLAGPSFAWAIGMLDLGVFLPATIATCVGLVRERLWAYRALCLVVGWFALVGLAVAGMAIAMYVNDDPNASAANAMLMTVLGTAFVALALWVFQGLFPQPRLATRTASSR